MTMVAHMRLVAVTIVLFLFAGTAPAADAPKGGAADVEKRIEKLQNLMEKNGSSAESLFQLGNAYYDAGKKEEAAKKYAASLDAGGGLEVLVNLTVVLAELDRREEADQVFRDAIERSPKNALLYAYQGDFLADDPDTARGVSMAMTAYRRALALDEKCIEAHFGLGVLFADAGIYDEAVREWETALRLDDKHRLALRAKQNIDRISRQRGR